ncbi:DUF642 domain-containing protein, partial [bacterium]|nr:DUF642 domain-containing protein [bacterium]
MKPSPRILHLLSILTLSPLGITPSYAELAANLQNGGFETGAPVAGAPFEQFQLDAWTVSGDAKAIAVTLQPTFSTTEGSRLAIFNGGGEQFGGRISQSFATVPGTLYRLRFDAGISVSPSWAPRAQRLAVKVAGTAEPLGSAQINLTGIDGAVQWSAQRLSFIADSTTTTLTFTDQSADLVSPSAQFSDLLLDHVRANANTAPLAADDSYAASADTALMVAAADGVLRNDADGEADPLTAVVVAGPSHGT